MTTLDQIHRSMDRYRGRFLGFIEALDLDPKKEAHLKRQCKSWSYDLELEITKAVESDTGEKHDGTNDHERRERSRQLRDGDGQRR